MEEKPLVSVIIVVKNGELFLKQAIDSVLAQTYNHYEIIIIDGNSKDNTATIATDYPQIRYFLQQSQGIANAYNEGIEKAEGELIAFLSHDDLWTTDKLQQQVDYMIAHPEIQYTVTKIKFFLEDNHAKPLGFREEWLQGDRVGKIMETLVTRKNLFTTIGNFNPEFNVAEDVDWFARTNDANISMAIVDRVLLYKRIHSHNLSLNAPENNENLLTILRKSIHRKRNSSQQ